MSKKLVNVRLISDGDYGYSEIVGHEVLASEAVDDNGYVYFFVQGKKLIDILNSYGYGFTKGDSPFDPEDVVLFYDYEVEQIVENDIP